MELVQATSSDPEGFSHDQAFAHTPPPRSRSRRWPSADDMSSSTSTTIRGAFSPVVLPGETHSEATERWRQRRGVPLRPTVLVDDADVMAMISTLPMSEHIDLPIRDDNARDEDGNRSSGEGGDDAEVAEGATATAESSVAGIASGSASGTGVAAPKYGDVCSICLEAFAAGDTLRALPCLHRFHADCVDTWIVACVHARQPCSCPNCKHVVWQRGA